jgi:hypothetical protein
MFEPAGPLEAIESEPMQAMPPSAQDEPGGEPRRMSVEAGWSVIANEKKPATIAPEKKPYKKGKDPQLTESWLLAVGAPDDEPEKEARPASMTRALTQYAILVFGLGLVLIGVIVMVANSHGS